MSIDHLSWVLNHSESEGRNRLVMIVLGDLVSYHEGDDQLPEGTYCWPSVNLIADRAKVSRRTVTRALSELCDTDELVRLDRHGDGRSSLYAMPLAPSQPGVGGGQVWPDPQDTVGVGGEPLLARQGSVSDPLEDPSIGDSDESPTLEMETELHPDLIAPTLEEDFEGLWLMWCPPKDCPKGNKQAAKKAFLRHAKVGLDREMAQAVMTLYADEMYATNKGRNDSFQQAWCHLSTLLNDWEQYAERIREAEAEAAQQPAEIDVDAVVAEMLGSN